MFRKFCSLIMIIILVSCLSISSFAETSGDIIVSEGGQNWYTKSDGLPYTVKHVVTKFKKGAGIYDDLYKANHICTLYRAGASTYTLGNTITDTTSHTHSVSNTDTYTAGAGLEIGIKEIITLKGNLEYSHWTAVTDTVGTSTSYSYSVGETFEFPQHAPANVKQVAYFAGFKFDTYESIMHTWGQIYEDHLYDIVQIVTETIDEGPGGADGEGSSGEGPGGNNGPDPEGPSITIVTLHLSNGEKVRLDDHIYNSMIDRGIINLDTMKFNRPEKKWTQGYEVGAEFKRAKAGVFPVYMDANGNVLDYDGNYTGERVPGHVMPPNGGTPGSGGDGGQAGAQ